MRLHTLTVTEITEDETTFDLTDCPRDGGCAVWHECIAEGCTPPEDDDLEDLDEFEAHGRLHRKIDYDWMVQDEPYNCGAHFVTDWFGLDGVAESGGLGVYEFDVDWDGDNWIALGFEKVSR